MLNVFQLQIYLPFKRAFFKKKKLEFPTNMNALYKVWLKLNQWFFRGSKTCEKLQTDRQRVMRKAQLNFWLR